MIRVSSAIILHFKINLLTYFWISIVLSLLTFPIKIWLAVLVIVFILLKYSVLNTTSSTVILSNNSSDVKVYFKLLFTILKFDVL